jgi:hypothetical protein
MSNRIYKHKLEKNFIRRTSCDGDGNTGKDLLGEKSTKKPLDEA